VTLESTKTDRTRKRIGSRRGWRKWIHLVTYGNHRLYHKKDTTQLYHNNMYFYCVFSSSSNTTRSYSGHSQRRHETRS
jgi:hypothetical protein